VARTVYSHRFITEQTFSGSVSVTPAPGTLLVIRDITIFRGSQPAGSEGTCTVGHGPIVFQWTDQALTPGYDHLDRRIVIPPGDTFDVNVTRGNADIVVSGYQLTTP